MTRITCIVSLALLAGFAPGCKKKAPENPRCRIFEQDLAQTQSGAFAEVKAAYEDAALVAECARAAGKAVDDFVAAHNVGAKIEWLTGQLHPAADNVLSGAKQTIDRAKQEAQQAMDHSLDRIDEGIKAAQGLVQ
jgi:hypothetical protein